MWMSGPATHVEALDSSEPPFVVVTVPVLSTTPPPPGQKPPVAEVVGEMMCTVNVLAACVVPAGTVTGPQFSVPAVIEHVLFQPAPWLSICHESPAFVGSGSLRVTPFASPVPEFETVSVNPIWSPAFTCGASAVLTMWMSTPPTQVDALDSSEPSFVVVTLPVLSTTPPPPGQK